VSMVIKFISSIILSLGGMLAIKNIENTKIRLGIKQVIALLVLSLATFFFSKVEFSMLQTILIFIVMIVAYKIVFDFEMSKAILYTAIVMILGALLDALFVLATMWFVDVEAYHTSYFWLTVSNLYILIGMYLITRIKGLTNRISHIVNKTAQNKIFSIILEVVLCMILLFILTYAISKNMQYNLNYIVALLIYVLVAIILFIYFRELNNYNKLLDEYDTLIEYVQTFEEWIEDEQLELHESKNTLSIIYSMTDIKEVRKEINKILNRKGTIEDNWVISLKAIPKGGLKGLLYYKFMLAKNNKLNLVVDVSDKVTSRLKKLSKEDIKLLLRLIGIYFDNAIEASTLSKEKNISFEVYKLKNQIHMVITNTYKGNINIDDIGKKGVSTKGLKRGKGTYLANKLVSKNKNFEINNSIINGYYVQRIIIK